MHAPLLLPRRVELGPSFTTSRKQDASPPQSRTRPDGLHNSSAELMGSMEHGDRRW